MRHPVTSLHAPCYATLMVALALASAVPAGAQTRPTIVPGEILLYCQPGTPASQADALAAQVQPASVTPLLLPDCYVIELPASQRTDAATLAAVATLKPSSIVRWVGASPQFYPMQAGPPTLQPNDPYYTQGAQWALANINMPAAWVLQQGQPGHNICFIDSGFDPMHEDAKGQFAPGSFDFADNDSDITADGTGPEYDHGTCTSGEAIALTNNGIGIAGVDWLNIKCVGLKVQPGGQANLSTPAILNAEAYVAARHTDFNIDVVNMSLGFIGGDPNDQNNPEYQAALSMVNNGVILVASAGNTGDTTPVLPADYKFAVSVSALNKQNKLSYYSSFGKVDLAAPGGEQFSATDTGGVLCLVQNSMYGYFQGTSLSAPHVAAVAELLRCVPGVTQQLAVQVMEQTANWSAVGLPSAPTVGDAKFGFGLLDAYAALAKVSVNVHVLDPPGIDLSSNAPGLTPPPVETLRPLVRFQIGNVPTANVTFSIDGNNFTYADLQNGAVPNAVDLQPIQGNATGPNPQYVIAFRYTFPATAPFQHTVSITGTNPGSGTVSTDTRSITVRPHQLPSGLTFISIPYYESAQDSPTGQFRDVNQLLGNVTLDRWLDVQALNAQGQLATVGQYAVDGPGIISALSPYASLRPPDAAPSLVPTNPGDPTNVAPVGLAWFMQSGTAINVVTYGINFEFQAVRVPLHEGWNMVGDPFPFIVPFNATQITLPSGNTITAGAAVDQHLILPNLYRLVGGDYVFDTLPGGALQPWQGHWLYVIPVNPGHLQSSNVASLVIPPTPAGGTGASAAAVRSRTASPRRTAPGDWSLQLAVRSGNLVDTHNYIGIASGATTGDDATKVPKPPSVAPFIQLAVVRPRSMAGLYAQDLEPPGGARSWQLSVQTSVANSDVSLSWAGVASVPRNVRLTLTDKQTGQTIDMRRQGSYRYSSGAAGAVRQFTVSSSPTAAEAPPSLSNVVVRENRAAAGRAVPAFEIGYTLAQDATVDVAVRAASGRLVARVSEARAAKAGDNTLVWNGMDGAGRPLPTGVYEIEIRAVSASNQVTRAVRPLLITGR